VKIRLLFLAVVTPIGVVGRVTWRRRLDLGFDSDKASYWRDRRGGRVTKAALREKP
jgi:hypothetical protein